MSDYNGTVHPTHIVWQGRHFPIVRGSDGYHYIADVGFHLPLPHVGIPIEGVIAPGLPGGYGSQMGAIPQGAVQGAAAAANFIPGVGPFISAGIEILGSLFGGGDPTPIGSLWEQIIGMRQQLADMRNAMSDAGYGPPDTFDAAGIDPDDPDTGGVLSAIITNEVLNKYPGVTDGETLRHQIKRADEYAAIKQLQGMVQQTNQQIASVEQQAHDTQLLHEVQQALSGGGSIDQGGDTTDGGSGSVDQGGGTDPTAAPASGLPSWAPWLAGGAGLLLIAYLGWRA